MGFTKHVRPERRRKMSIIIKKKMLENKLSFEKNKQVFFFKERNTFRVISEHLFVRLPTGNISVTY